MMLQQASTSTEDPHQLSTLSTSVTLHVSRDCVLTTFVAHDEFCPCGEANAREWVSGNTSPQPLYNKRICHLWKRSVCQQLKLLQTRINDTDRLTLLYVKPQPHHTTYHGYTFTSFTARQRMMAERTAVRFENDQDSRKNMTIIAGNDLHVFLDGMEKPTHILLVQDVLCRMMKEPRYKNGICVVPGLKHNLLEEPNLQPNGAGHGGCHKSMAWKHCCASSRHTVLSLRCLTWRLHLLAFVYKLKMRNANRWPSANDTDTNRPRFDGLWQGCNGQ